MVKGSRLPGGTLVEKLALNWRPDGECRRWTGAHTPKGYGQVAVDGKVKQVHRVSYEIHCGPIPDGYEVDHRCRVRDCYRPDHLEAVTHLENVRRGDSPAMQAARRSTCPRGHARTPENLRISVDGSRRCRVCRNELRNARRLAKRTETTNG